MTDKLRRAVQGRKKIPDWAEMLRSQDFFVHNSHKKTNYARISTNYAKGVQRTAKML